MQEAQELHGIFQFCNDEDFEFNVKPEIPLDLTYKPKEGSLIQEYFYYQKIDFDTADTDIIKRRLFRLNDIRCSNYESNDFVLNVNCEYKFGDRNAAFKLAESKNLDLNQLLYQSRDATEEEYS